MSVSLRLAARASGDDIDGEDVLEILANVGLGRYRVTDGFQVQDGRANGLTARVLTKMGWEVSELVGLDSVHDIQVLYDRGLEVPPEDPHLADAGLFTADAIEVLLTLQWSEDMGNTWGQACDKAAKCLELLRAGI